MSAGVTLDKNIILEIEAPTHADARAIMFHHFRSEWSMQYDKLPNMEYFPRGIYKLR